MNRVVTAIETGKCVVAVSSALLRDESVVLAIREREAVPFVALSGHVQHPVRALSAKSLVRATAAPGGVVLVVEPAGPDDAGMRQLAEIIAAGAHKPTVLVLGRANPLLLASLFRGVTVDTLKGRGKMVLRQLPIPAADALPPAPEPVASSGKKTSGDSARFVFAGREDEVASLSEMLGQGGPVVVSGPHGVGRTQLVEHAIAATELTRLPDVNLGRGSGFDTLVGRLAELGKASGHSALADLLATERTPVQVVEACVAAVQAASGDQVMVVHGLETAIGRQGDAFRRGRLELLIQALLTMECNLRLVFTSVVQPVFFREGAAANLRRLELTGIKGRFLHEIFEGMHAPEFSRDKFGPMFEKMHGHPLSARTYAVAAREHGVQIVDDAKYMKLKGPDDTETVKKALGKLVDKLPKELRNQLSRVAHLRYPVSGQFLSEMGLARKHRMALLRLGLLDVVGTLEDKRYRVHRLVGLNMDLREISDFDVHKELAERYSRISRNADGMDRLWTSQEANRQFVMGRALRDRLSVPYPDNDAMVESTWGMIRSRKPRPDLAERRLREVLKDDPSNSEAWLNLFEAQFAQNAEHDAIVESLDTAMAKAPVPEIFHQAVRFYLGRRKRNKAIVVLQAGVAALPDQSRLKCRLASMLLRDGRRNEALELLQQAMDADPMLPDAYGLLGNARRDEGMDALDDAEQLLREAVRLAPEDSVQLARLAHLLFDRARVDDSRRQAQLEEARDLLDTALRIDKKSAEGHLLMARVTLAVNQDVERARWLLDKARKLTDRNPERKARIRLAAATADMYAGDFDKAEQAVRELIGRDPSNVHSFAALATILEARQQYIPAHAEYLRAKDRCHEKSLERHQIDRNLERLQALIEAQAAGLAMPAPELATAGVGAPKSHSRVIRRRGGEQTDIEDPAVKAAEDLARESIEAAAAPADVEAEPTAPEAAAAPADVEAEPTAPEASAEPSEALEAQPTVPEATADSSEAIEPEAAADAEASNPPEASA